jgi:hypothetical protein
MEMFPESPMLLKERKEVNQIKSRLNGRATSKRWKKIVFQRVLYYDPRDKNIRIPTIKIVRPTEIFKVNGLEHQPYSFTLKMAAAYLTRQDCRQLRCQSLIGTPFMLNQTNFDRKLHWSLLLRHKAFLCQ